MKASLISSFGPSAVSLARSGDVDEVARVGVLRRVMQCQEARMPVTLLVADHNYNLHWRKRDYSRMVMTYVSLARMLRPSAVRRVTVGQGLAAGEEALMTQVIIG
jgi:hypothetical protein